MKKYMSNLVIFALIVLSVSQWVLLATKTSQAAESQSRQRVALDSPKYEKITTGNYLINKVNKGRNFIFRNQTQQVFIQPSLQDLFKAIRSKDVERVEKLLAQGVGVNSRNTFGVTPLMDSLYLDDSSMARLLLRLGANPNAKDVGGNSVLMIAVDNGHLDIVKEIATARMNVNDQSNSGETPLIIASRNGYLRTIQFLLSNGGDVNVKTKKGETALMVASNHTDVVSALINAGANVDAANNQGRTALMYASLEGQPEKVQALLNKGARSDVRDINGENALSLAEQAKHKIVVDILKGTYRQTVTQNSTGVITYAQPVGLTLRNGSKSSQVSGEAILMFNRAFVDGILIGRLTITFSENTRQIMANLAGTTESSFPSKIDIDGIKAKLALSMICPPTHLEVKNAEWDLAGIKYALNPVRFALDDSSREVNRIFCEWAKRIEYRLEVKWITQGINTILRRAVA